MPVDRIINSPSDAYMKIRKRLEDDFSPLWGIINHTEGYSPFWLLCRGLMPIAESIGDLIYKDKSTSKNLENFLDNDLSKINPAYANKGALIAILYRHSLMHHDEPRSIYVGNISIFWNIAYIDGRDHLKASNKNSTTRSFILQFDLRKFYEDLIALLKLYETNGPKKGVKTRYNSWTFASMKKLSENLPKWRQDLIVEQVKNLYLS